MLLNLYYSKSAFNKATRIVLVAVLSGMMSQILGCGAIYKDLARPVRPLPVFSDLCSKLPLQVTLMFGSEAVTADTNPGYVLGPGGNVQGMFGVNYMTLLRDAVQRQFESMGCKVFYNSIPANDLPTLTVFLQRLEYHNGIYSGAMLGLDILGVIPGIIYTSLPFDNWIVIDSKVTLTARGRTYWQAEVRTQRVWTQSGWTIGAPSGTALGDNPSVNGVGGEFGQVFYDHAAEIAKLAENAAERLTAKQ